MDKWEYTSEIIHAHIDNKGVKEAIAKKYPGWRPSKYSPELLEPSLDKLGMQGWELVSMQPIAGVGDNRDIYFVGGGSLYSNAYFCVFKRRIES